VENPGLREVRVSHPETGELVLVTREEILEHGDDDRRMLEAAERYAEREAAWHGRLIRALRSYGDDSTSVGEAVRRAAADLGVDQAGRSSRRWPSWWLRLRRRVAAQRLGDSSQS
jgi:hypothetical protein